MWLTPYSDPLEAFLNKSDLEVLREASKNPRVFFILVDRYKDAFLRKARTIVRNEEDAEEIVLEAFTKIYQYADRFQAQEGATFTSWGYKILMNAAFTKYQKQKRVREGMVDFEQEFYEILPDLESRQFEKQEIGDYVVSALARLPEQMSRVLTLYFFEGKSQNEIAAIEHTSVGAIKTRMHRAKGQLKEVIKSLPL